MIPSVRQDVDTQVTKAQKNIRHEMFELFNGKGNENDLSFITRLPCDGLERQEIVNLVGEYLKLGKW